MSGHPVRRSRRDAALTGAGARERRARGEAQQSAPGSHTLMLKNNASRLMKDERIGYAPPSGGWMPMPALRGRC